MRWFGMVFLSLFAGMSAWAGGDKPGDFDYYVMALSWSANWCAMTGDDRHDPQCDAGRNLTFTLHGLWPQFEQGYPSDCFAQTADPSRSDTALMADIMGAAGVAFHEWQKHGRCSGLSAAAYYATMRKAYAAVTIPPIFARVSRTLSLPASVIEAAFLDSNPALTADEVTVICNQSMIAEVRICLSKDLQPRVCGQDVARDCSLSDAELDAVR